MGRFVDVRLLAVVGAALVLALAIERARALRLRRPALGLVATWIAVPLLLVAVASPLLGVNLVHSRYVLVIVPGVALALATLAGLPRRPLAGWVLIGVFVGATLLLVTRPMLQGQGWFRSFYYEQHWERAAAALVEKHREGDRVFYGTKFVELEAIVSGRAPDVVVDFASWPLRAHLLPDRDYGLQALPYRFDRDTRGALLEALREAPGRVWLVGLSDPVRRTLPLATRAAGFAQAEHQRFGIVHLVRLEPRPEGAGAGPGGS